jgi:hypothetical protein
MSIVSASALTAADIRLLGNNLGPYHKSFRRRQRRRLLRAVNRSLAPVGERVGRLRPMPLAAR